MLFLLLRILFLGTRKYARNEHWNRHRHSIVISTNPFRPAKRRKKIVLWWVILCLFVTLQMKMYIPSHEYRWKWTFSFSFSYGLRCFYVSKSGQLIDWMNAAANSVNVTHNLTYYTHSHAWYAIFLYLFQFSTHRCNLFYYHSHFSPFHSFIRIFHFLCLVPLPLFTEILLRTTVRKVKTMNDEEKVEESKKGERKKRIINWNVLYFLNENR